MRSLILGFLFSSVFFVAGPANAAIVYVDNRSSCPGNGSSATPYCSIANALNNAAAGQNIKIRTGTGVYSETAEVRGKNGTSSNPIILEPDTGANFIIRNSSTGNFTGSIKIKESDYWTIRNLTFDASGVNPSLVALHAQCETKNCVGWLIIGNTFKNWTQLPGATYGPGVLYFAGCSTIFGCPANRTITGTIEDNIFHNNDMNSMQVFATLNTVIQRNTVTGQRCGRETDGAGNAVGIKIAFGSKGLRVLDNNIHDFVPKANCHVTGFNSGNYQNSVGIYSDVCLGNTDNDVRVEGNVIYNIDQGSHNYTGVNGAAGHQSSGIFIEAGCADWTVIRNVIYRIGNEGIIFSYHSLNTAQTTNNAFYNTIYDVQHGIFLKEGVVTIKNNIVKNATGAALCLGCGSGSPSSVKLTANYNLHDDGGSQTKIGIKNGTTYNLTNWRTQCGCDANSLVGDPLFVSLTTPDFHLQTGSPAVGKGEAGTDIGRYPYIATAVPQAPSNPRVVQTE